MLYKVKQKLNFFVPEMDMNPLIAFLKRKKKKTKTLNVYFSVYFGLILLFTIEILDL